MKTYGIISDIHSKRPDLAGQAAQILKEKGAQALILNGDLVGDRFPGMGEQEFVSRALQYCAQTGLPIYAHAGSHEDVPQFEPVIQTLAAQIPNIIDVSKDPKIELGDHHLIFLPGSDWHAGRAAQNGYSLALSEMETGIYNTENGPVGVTNISDLRTLVTDPAKTILITHIPRKFDNIETGVDMAYFAERANGDLSPGIMIEGMIRQQFGDIDEVKLNLIAAQNGFTFKRENRGNQDLADIMEEVGITKNITGHFHESIQRAHNLQCNPLAQGNFGSELFWNASYLDEGMVGLLHVNGTQVAYENIDLSDYMR
jgi:Icc-related predicted phosphoesterase